MARVREEEGEAGVIASRAGFYSSTSAVKTNWCLVSAAGRRLGCWLIAWLVGFFGCTPQSHANPTSPSTSPHTQQNHAAPHHTHRPRRSPATKRASAWPISRGVSTCAPTSSGLLGLGGLLADAFALLLGTACDPTPPHPPTHPIMGHITTPHPQAHPPHDRVHQAGQVGAGPPRPLQKVRGGGWMSVPDWV
jgi:hypothetical protein